MKQGRLPKIWRCIGAPAHGLMQGGLAIALATAGVQKERIKKDGWADVEGGMSMKEIFKQTIPTRTGMYIKQTLLTFLLAYALIIGLTLLVAQYAAGQGLQNLVLSIIPPFTALFAIACAYKLFLTPKEIELVLTDEKLHAYNGLGFRKGYVDLDWNEIIDIRRIALDYHVKEVEGPNAILVGNSVLPNPAKVMADASNIAIGVEQGILSAQESRILPYAASTDRMIYVFDVDSRNEEEFVGKTRKLGKYNPKQMGMDEMWRKKGGLLYFLKRR